MCRAAGGRYRRTFSCHANTANSTFPALPRAGLEQLLALADYVVSSAHFPSSWTGEQCLGDALLATLGWVAAQRCVGVCPCAGWLPKFAHCPQSCCPQTALCCTLPCPRSRLPRARWLITTLGSRGSVLLERTDSVAGGEAQPAVLDELVERLFSQAASSGSQPGAAGPACVSASGVAVHSGSQATSGGVHALQLRRGAAETQQALQAAAQAAAAAAAANADAGNAAGYAMQPGGAAGPAEVHARVTVATAAQLPAEAVVDTTGAGDSFIGSILYGLATGMPVQRAMQLGAVVAACKCTALGARPGLPRRSNLQAALLQP